MDPSAYSDAPRYVCDNQQAVKGGNLYRLVSDLSPDVNIFIIKNRLYSNTQ